MDIHDDEIGRFKGGWIQILEGDSLQNISVITLMNIVLRSRTLLLLIRTSMRSDQNSARGIRLQILGILIIPGKSHPIKCVWQRITFSRFHGLLQNDICSPLISFAGVWAFSSFLPYKLEQPPSHSKMRLYQRSSHQSLLLDTSEGAINTYPFLYLRIVQEAHIWDDHMPRNVTHLEAKHSL